MTARQGVFGTAGHRVVTMFSDLPQASVRTWLLKSLVDLLEAEQGSQ